VGVFGKLAKLDAVLHAGDRVEIYRPLIADPKEVRKKRAAQGKVMKKGAAAAGDA
jgi:putative ubiquitin-RnfH superfamily antitoxin RatB of RatAB toxin-antitoxin module